jgi:hypothetical protein
MTASTKKPLIKTTKSRSNLKDQSEVEQIKALLRLRSFEDLYEQTIKELRRLTLNGKHKEAVRHLGRAKRELKRCGGARFNSETYDFITNEYLKTYLKLRHLIVTSPDEVPYYRLSQLVEDLPNE